MVAQSAVEFAIQRFRTAAPFATPLGITLGVRNRPTFVIAPAPAGRFIFAFVGTTTVVMQYIRNGDGSGMILRYPATRWQDALPTGSGVVGAMLYGNVQADQVLLNHDGLYFPTEMPPSLDVSKHLPEVRRLIAEGECRAAADVMPNAYAGQTGSEPGSTSAGRDPYQPFCTIDIATRTDGPFRDYRRGVDFATGRAWVEWSERTAGFTREVFVSRITDVVYLRIASDKPAAVSCALSLIETPCEQVKGRTVASSALDRIRIESTQAASADERTLTFTGTYANGFSFGAVGHLTTVGGTVTAVDDALLVEGADEVVLRVNLALGTTPGNEGERDFDKALAEHAAAHGELFHRVTLSLDERDRVSNEELLMDAFNGDVAVSLIQRMFEFGRYLLICSSRVGGWPANLQGIWNGDYAPAWNADVHTDENIQMNYWQALPGALPEVALPLFDYFEKHVPDFRENAKNLFNCRGVLVPIAMTTHGREVPCSWSNWTAAAGWIAQHFYDYFLFTGDRRFLADRALPWLKQVAMFYEDFLFEADDGRLVFNPSLSPENRPANGNSLLCINATMDIAICREVLTNLCEGCRLLGIEAEGVARWRAMLDKLPEYEVNDDGAMKEWLHPAFEDNYHHRHQSHVYPVFPGLEVTAESNRRVYDACRVAVEKRLVIGLTSQTGWSMAHMANVYARLGQGDRANECLELITRASTGPNLLTYHNDWRKMGLTLGTWGAGHPPFQIDANLGFTAAVLEMLAFSKPGLVKLLPALPGGWTRGSVSGIACRGGVTLDMQWDQANGDLTAKLASNSDQRVRVHLPAMARPIAGEQDERVLDLDLVAGEPRTITTE